MDEFIEKIAALGVPGLILVVAIDATGLAGGAAITAALAAIGPGGMIFGIATLGVIGVIAEALTEWGVDAVFSAIVQELYESGENRASILKKIERYPISKKLKSKLREKLR